MATSQEAELRIILRARDEATRVFKQVSDSLKAVGSNMRGVEKNTKLVADSVAKMSESAKVLRDAFNALNASAGGLQKSAEGLKAVHEASTRKIKQQNTSLKESKKDLGEVSQRTERVTHRMTELNQSLDLLRRTFQILNATIGDTLKVYSEYNKGMVVVQRVTDRSADQIHEFSDKFDEMAISLKAVPIRRLNEIAGQAAQLGLVASDDITLFTETVGKLETSLVDLGQKAPKLMVRVLNATQEGIGGIEKFGNVLVRIAKSASAAEHHILHMTAQLANSTAQFNVGSESLLAFAAAAADLNIASEVFGGVMNRSLTKLYEAALTNTEGMRRYSAMIGVTAKEMTKLIDTDPAEALLRFATALKAVGDSTDGHSPEEFLRMFGLAADENRRVWGSVAENVHIFRDRLAEARIEAVRLEALNQEFNTTLTAFFATTTKAANAWYLLRKEFGKALAPAAKVFLDLLTSTMLGLIDVIEFLPDIVIQGVAALTSLVAIFVGLRVAILASQTAFAILFGNKFISKLFTGIALYATAALGSLSKLRVGLALLVGRAAISRVKVFQGLLKGLSWFALLATGRFGGLTTVLSRFVTMIPTLLAGLLPLLLVFGKIAALISVGAGIGIVISTLLFGVDAVQKAIDGVISGVKGLVSAAPSGGVFGVLGEDGVVHAPAPGGVVEVMREYHAARENFEKDGSGQPDFNMKSLKAEEFLRETRGLALVQYQDLRKVRDDYIKQGYTEFVDGVQLRMDRLDATIRAAGYAIDVIQDPELLHDDDFLKGLSQLDQTILQYDAKAKDVMSQLPTSYFVDVSPLSTVGQANQQILRDMDSFTKNSNRARLERYALEDLREAGPYDSFFSNIGLLGVDDITDYMSKFEEVVKYREKIANPFFTFSEDIENEIALLTEKNSEKREGLKLDREILEAYRDMNFLLGSTGLGIDDIRILLESKRRAKLDAIARDEEFDLSQQLNTAMAITVEDRNRLEINRRIMELHREHGESFVASGIRELMQATQVIQSDTAFRDRTIELNNQLDTVSALTQARKDEVAVLQDIQKYEKDNGVLSKERRAQMESQLQGIRDIQNIVRAINAADQGFNSLIQYMDNLEGLELALERGVIGQTLYQKMVASLTKEFEKAKDPLADIRREILETAELQSIMGPNVDAERDALSRVFELRRLNFHLTEDQVAVIRELSYAMSDLTLVQEDGFEAWSDEIGTVTNRVLEMQSSLADSFRSSLVDAIYGAEDAWRQFFLSASRRFTEFYLDNLFELVADGIGNNVFGLLPGVPTQDQASKRALDAADEANRMLSAIIQTQQVDLRAAVVNIQGLSGGLYHGDPDLGSLSQISDAVANMESGGNYGAIGPAPKSEKLKHNRAYGKYQVMDFNVGPWTERFYGKELTPDQFLKNPEAQEAVFAGKMGSLLKEHGNVRDALAVWHSGRPYEGNTSSDGYMTTIQYVDEIMQDLQSTAPVVAASLKSMNDATVSVGTAATVANPQIRAVGEAQLAAGNQAQGASANTDVLAVATTELGTAAVGAASKVAAASSAISGAGGVGTGGTGGGGGGGTGVASGFSGINWGNVGTAAAAAGAAAGVGLAFNALLNNSKSTETVRVWYNTPNTADREVPLNFHNGGVVGGRPLENNEFRAVLERGERVLTRQDNDRVERVLSKVGEGAHAKQPVTVNMNITTPDAQSFRATRASIMAKTQAGLSRATRRRA